MAQFEIHSLDGSRAEQAFALASLNFATQSVLHKALGADFEEYRAYLCPTFFDDLSDGLSLMATGPGSGELMGILVVRGFRKQRFAGALPYQDKYAQISALFEELEAIYLQTRQIAAGDALLVDMAAVPPAHAVGDWLAAGALGHSGAGGGKSPHRTRGDMGGIAAGCQPPAPVAR